MIAFTPLLTLYQPTKTTECIYPEFDILRYVKQYTMCAGRHSPLCKWYLGNLIIQTKELLALQWTCTASATSSRFPVETEYRNVFSLGHLHTTFMMLRHQRLCWLAHACLSNEEWPHTKRFSYENSHLEKTAIGHLHFDNKDVWKRGMRAKVWALITGRKQQRTPHYEQTWYRTGSGKTRKSSWVLLIWDVKEDSQQCQQSEFRDRDREDTN